MSRDERFYLEDILQYCDEVTEHIRGMAYADFLTDRRTYKAVAYSPLVIGEAAKHVTPERRARHPEVQWGRIAGLRDVLAHDVP